MRLREVSRPRQHFVRECQRIGFGRIACLTVRGAEPLFTEQTVVFLDLKLCEDDEPRPEQNLSDFMLTTEIVRLFSMLDTIRDGVIEHIEIRTGIPRRIVVKASELQINCIRTIH